MALEEFVKKTLLDNSEHVEEIRRLREILESLDEHQRRPQVYAISVTSNT
jgi:hypothetical protein